METRLDLARWVDQNKPKIIKFSKKYIPYSGYELKDFIAEAYVVAFDADIKARANCKGFDYYFWGLLKKSYRNMTFTKGLKLSISHESHIENPDDDEMPTITNRSNINIEENNFINSIEDRTFEVFKEETADIEIKNALDKMRPLEKEVWIRLLNGKKLKEIAEEFGCKRQRIQNIRNSAIRRIKDSKFASRTRKKERKKVVIQDFQRSGNQNGYNY